MFRRQYKEHSIRWTKCPHPSLTPKLLKQCSIAGIYAKILYYRSPIRTKLTYFSSEYTAAAVLQLDRYLGDHITGMILSGQVAGMILNNQII